MELYSLIFRTVFKSLRAAPRSFSLRLVSYIFKRDDMLESAKRIERLHQEIFQELELKRLYQAPRFNVSVYKPP